MACEYCRNIDTGDDYHPLIETHQSLGLFGEFDVDLYLGNVQDSEHPHMILSVCPYRENGGVLGTQRIKYCPICGRELGI